MDRTAHLRRSGDIYLTSSERFYEVRRLKLACAVVVAWAALIALSGMPHAQTITLEAKGFPQVAARQQTPVWCWAAVTQSLLNYHRVAITQAEIVQSVKGRLAIETATMYEMWSVLNGWKTLSQGETYTIESLPPDRGLAPISVLMRTSGASAETCAPPTGVAADRGSPRPPMSSGSGWRGPLAWRRHSPDRSCSRRRTTKRACGDRRPRALLRQVEERHAGLVVDARV